MADAVSSYRVPGDGGTVAAFVPLRLEADGQPDAGPISSNTCARVAGTFNRPADTTAYAVGDLVANNTTAGSVAAVALAVARVPGGTGQIVRMRLRKSGASLTNASFRVHLFRAAPTVANGDNGAFSASGAADYLGAADVPFACGAALDPGHLRQSRRKR